MIILDLSEDAGKKVADELKCEFVKADVTSREDWQKVVKFADEKYDAIHAVVNNAGTTYKQKVSRNDLKARYIILPRLTANCVVYARSHRLGFRQDPSRERQIPLLFRQHHRPLPAKERQRRHLRHHRFHSRTPAPAEFHLVQRIQSRSHQRHEDHGRRVCKG